MPGTATNSIVLLVDSLRRDHVGAYGPSRAATPAIDAFARRAVRFDHAYVGSYPCLPLRRDLWTGRFEFPFRGWGPLEPDEWTFPLALRQAGRTSQLITDHYHLWERGAGNYHFDFSGVDFIRGNELDNYITDPTIPIHYPAAPEKLAGHAGPGAYDRYARNISGRRTERDHFVAQVVQRAMDWLDRNHSTAGFCLFLDCFDPHEPWDPPQAYVDLYDPGYHGESVTWPTYGDDGYLTAEELQHVQALYAAEVTMVDRWLGILLDHIERLGLMETTTIVLTTDHGVLLGERGTIGKPSAAIGDSSIYTELSHIPLLVYTPGCLPGSTVSEMVQAVDLCPTILDAAGLPVPAGLDGRSLLALARGEEVEDRPRYACFGRFGEMAGITDGEWLLHVWPPGPDNQPLYWYSYTPPPFLTTLGPLVEGRYWVEGPRGEQTTALFNLHRDPGQTDNLIDRYPSEGQRLATALAYFLRGVHAPRDQFVRLGLPVTESGASDTPLSTR